MSSTLPLPQDVWDALPVEAHALFQTMQLQIQAMRLQIDALQAEVQTLKAQLGTHSRNSSKPPSGDPIHLKRQPPRPPSGKKRGGQPGHKRATRPLVPPHQLQNTITCKPACCAGCGGVLEGSDPDPVRHQVAEIPPIRPEVIEYRIHRLTCRGCGKTTRAPLPEGVPYGSFGPRLRATLSLWAAEFRLAKRPVQRLAKNFLGLDISLGMIAKLERQTAMVLGPVDDELAEVVRLAQWRHIDETPWREANGKAWLWIASSDQATHFRIATNRKRRNSPSDPGGRQGEGGDLRPVFGLRLGGAQTVVLGSPQARFPGDDRPAGRWLGRRVKLAEAVRRVVLGLAPGG